MCASPPRRRRRSIGRPRKEPPVRPRPRRRAARGARRSGVTEKNRGACELFLFRAWLGRWVCRGKEKKRSERLVRGAGRSPGRTRTYLVVLVRGVLGHAERLGDVASPAAFEHLDAKEVDVRGLARDAREGGGKGAAGVAVELEVGGPRVLAPVVVGHDALLLRLDSDHHELLARERKRSLELLDVVDLLSAIHNALGLSGATRRDGIVSGVDAERGGARAGGLGAAERAAGDRGGRESGSGEGAHRHRRRVCVCMASADRAEKLNNNNIAESAHFCESAD